MERRYYRKKDPSVQGTDIRWIEMNGLEFCDFVASPEGKDRYFIDLDEYVIEATKEIYDEWHREKAWKIRQMKLKKIKGIEIASFQSSAISQFGHGEEVTPDPTVDVEDDAICLAEIKELRVALCQLDDSSRLLIQKLFLDEDRKSEREMAKLLGISQPAVHKRKIKLLEKLRLLVIDGFKSVQ